MNLCLNALNIDKGVCRSALWCDVSSLTWVPSLIYQNISRFGSISIQCSSSPGNTSVCSDLRCFSEHCRNLYRAGKEMCTDMFIIAVWMDLCTVLLNLIFYFRSIPCKIRTYVCQGLVILPKCVISACEGQCHYNSWWLLHTWCRSETQPLLLNSSFTSLIKEPEKKLYFIFISSYLKKVY